MKTDSPAEGRLEIFIDPVPGRTLYEELDTLLTALNTGRTIVMTVMHGGSIEDVVLRRDGTGRFSAQGIAGSHTGLADESVYEELVRNGALGAKV